jgi:hypothetical protein
MPPTCAACREPIRTLDALCIAETEVLHRYCAIAGRRTLRWEVEARCTRVLAEHEAFKREVATLRGEARHAAMEFQGLERRREAWEREARLHAEAAAAAREEARLHAEAAATAREEVIRLRAELLALRTVAVDSRETSGDDRDGAVQRFSLLELD